MFYAGIYVLGRYFDDLHMSAYEEVRPEEAIARTLQTFVVVPFKTLGEGMGSLFQTFYGEGYGLLLNKFINII